MVTIKDYRVSRNSDGESFISLVLESELEMTQSKETGNWYATSRTCSITSTFDEATAASMIGKKLPGRIKKAASEPYEYTIEDTGEQVTLYHRYVYTADEAEVDDVIPSAIKANSKVFSENGRLSLAE